MAGFTDPTEFLKAAREALDEDDSFDTTSGFTDPFEFIRENRAASPEFRDKRMPFPLDFRRPIARQFQRPDPEVPEEQFEPLTAGDEDFAVEDYLTSAQTPSAHAEKELYDARQKARNALETDPEGNIFTAEERQALQAIAETGEPEESEGFLGGLLGVLDVIDRPGELIRAGVADVAGVDEKHGVEITLGDYWDMLRGNDEAVRERLGAEVTGDLGNFMFEGTHLLRELGVADEDDESAAIAGFAIDVALDPLTYLTFGTAGVGRKAAIEATAATATGAWKGGARAIREGSTEALSDPIEKRAARLIEERIQRDSDEAIEALRARKAEHTPRGQKAAPVTTREEQILRETARRSTLAKEERLISVFEGQKLSEVDKFTDDLLGLGDEVRFGTEFEKEVGQLAKIQAERRYGDLEKLFPEYIASDLLPMYAKGGIRVVPTPFGRKNVPMLAIPGTRRNAIAPRMWSATLDKMPSGTSRWLRDMAERTSKTRQLLNRAKDYDPYGNQLSPYVAAAASERAFGATKLGHRLHEVAPQARAEFASLAASAARHGVDPDEAINLTRQFMSNSVSPDALEALPQEVASHVFQSGRAIRGAFETIHAAAEEVGMRVGHIDEFIPLVSDSTYTKIVRQLVDSGASLDVARAADAEERLGRELIAAFVGSEGGRKPTAVRRLGESVHMRSRIGTAAFKSPVGGAEVTRLYPEEIADIARNAGLGYYDHDTLNRSLMKALRSLVDEGKVDPKLVGKLDDAPFETNLVHIMDSYMTSMSEAIRLTDQANRLRQAGMFMDRIEKVSITRTLHGVNESTNSARHPIMRFMDDLAEVVEAQGAESVARRASETVRVTIRKGWEIEVPAAVTGTKEFDRIVRRLQQSFDKTVRNANDARRAVEAHTHELVQKGVPAPLAERIALVDSNAELFDLMEEMRALGKGQAAQVRSLAAEQIALNAHKMTDDVASATAARAAREAADLRQGVEETVADMERQLAERLKVPFDTRADRVHDLSQAPSPRKGDNRSFLQWVADEADAEIARMGQVDEATDALLDREIVERAVDDLVDRARVVDLTVDDLAQHSDPRRAAITLAPLYDKLEEAVGREAAEELMSGELREALTDMFNAQQQLLDVRMGAVDMTLEQADEALRAAEGRVDELARATTELSEAELDLAREGLRDFADSPQVIRNTIERLVRGERILSTHDRSKAHAVAKWFHNRAQPTDNLYRGMELDEVPAVGETFELPIGNATRSAEEAAQFATGERQWIVVFGDGTPAALNPNNTNVPLVSGRFAVTEVDDTHRIVRVTAEHVEDVLPVPHAGLVGSDVLIGDVVEQVRPTVIELADDPLFSNGFNDVWSASMRKLRNMSRGEMAEEMRKQGVKSVGQTELFAQNTKQMNDFAAGRARLGWHEAALASIREGDIEEYVAPRIDKAIQALRAGDTAALPSFQDEIRLMIHYAWPSLDSSRVFVRPSGAVVFAEEVVEEGWVTLDDILPELRQVIPDGEGMDMAELVGTAVEAWRASPDDMEGLSEAASRWFRQLDGEGGFDYDLESFEYLRDFSARLRTAESELARAGRPATRVTQREVSTATAASALDEVLDAVDKAGKGGRGVGVKTLRNTFEKHVSTLKRGLPASIVDELRTLVDYTIGLRSAKLPKRILDKQVALRSHMWEPLEDVSTRAGIEIDELFDEAVASGNAALEDASLTMRHFTHRLVDLMSHGEAETVSRGVREGARNLVGDEDSFIEAFDAAKRALDDAIKATRKVADEDRTLLDDIVPPKSGKPQTIDKWVKNMEEQMARWEPKRVPVSEKEGFVDLSSRGIAGDIFGDAIAERHVALVLESMAGRLAQLGSEAGVEAMRRKMTGAIRWWRAAATVARPTFVPRNLIGGLFNGEIMMVPMKAYRMSATEILPAVRRVRSGAATWDEVIAEARPQARGYLQGIRDSDVLDTSFAVSDLEHLKRRVPLSDRLNPASPRNALFHGGAKIMEASEDFLRAAAFVAHYDPTRPATMHSARAVTLAAHFDYKNLTPTEVGIKKLVPFFTWTKNNIPLQIRTIFENPGVYTRYNHAVQNLRSVQRDTEADPFADSAFRGGLSVPLGFMLGEGTPYWSRAVFDPDLPFRDLEEMLGATGEGVPGMAEWALGLISPQYSAPVELFNTDYETNAPTGLAEIIKLTDPFLPGDATIGIDGSVRVPGWQTNLFRTMIPFSQELAEVGGVVPNTGNQAARLGYQTETGVDFSDRVRAAALRLGRAGGLQFQVPGDSESAAFLAENQVFDIQDRARLEGRLVDPEHREALIEAILERHGLN